MKKLYTNEPTCKPGHSISHESSSSNNSSQLKESLQNSNAAPSINYRLSSGKLPGSISKSVFLNNQQLDELVNQIIYYLKELRSGEKYLEEYLNTYKELLSTILDYNNKGNMYRYKGVLAEHDEICKTINKLCDKLIERGYRANLFTILKKIFKEDNKDDD